MIAQGRVQLRDESILLDLAVVFVKQMERLFCDIRRRHDSELSEGSNSARFK